MKKNKGFSLVELVIILAILAIIVGVAVPILGRYLEKSKKTADVQSAKAILEEFSTEYYSNPDFHDAVLDITSKGKLVAVCDESTNGWVTGVAGNAAVDEFFSQDCAPRQVKYQKSIDPRYTATEDEIADNQIKYALGSSNNFTPKGWAIAVVCDTPVVYVTDGGGSAVSAGVSPLVCPAYPNSGSQN
jgi:prepilin-type N-terminal cleavage/methylation domain-containing protein